MKNLSSVLDICLKETNIRTFLVIFAIFVGIFECQRNFLISSYGQKSKFFDSVFEKFEFEAMSFLAE